MNATNTSVEDALYVQSMFLLKNSFNEFLVLFFCGLLALVTNPLIIWTIWRQKSLHTGCFTLIAQLALADFLVGLSYVITMTKRFIRLGFSLGEVIPQLQCSGEMALNYFSETASLTLALAIGFERLLAAAMPIQFKLYEWKLARLTPIVAWLLPILEFCAIITVMLRSDYKLVNLCSAGRGVTPDLFAVQQIGKICLAVAIVVMYILALLTLTLQLAVAKRRGQRALTEMKKYLQVKMAYLVVALAVAYLVLQMTTRIALVAIVELPEEIGLKIAPPIRALMVVNSGIHLFFYISTSLKFREAFALSFGIKALFKGERSTNQVTPY